jgi:hypothetical protein
MMSTTHTTAIEPVLIEFEALTQTDAAASRAKGRVQRARAQLRTLLLGCCDVALDRRGEITEYRPRERGATAS